MFRRSFRPLDLAVYSRTLPHHYERKTMNTTSPHENEYLAAVAGLHDQTVSQRTFAVGDWVSGKSGGKTWSGRIVKVDGRKLDVECAGAWLVVSVDDVTH